MGYASAPLGAFHSRLTCFNRVETPTTPGARPHPRHPVHLRGRPSGVPDRDLPGATSSALPEGSSKDPDAGVGPRGSFEEVFNSPSKPDSGPLAPSVPLTRVVTP